MADRSVKYVAIIGTGFVADLYMTSLAVYPDIKIKTVWDIDADRLRAFTKHWNVSAATGLDDLLDRCTDQDLILNLTNPSAHYDVSRACIEAGRNVYSEKPLAMTLNDARNLHDLSKTKGVRLASAPCSYLSETAQTLWAALRDGQIGTPQLVYAELDDGYISQAPYEGWISASGAPWPAMDEFEVGCTLEHAGYYLTWLMMCFGPVRHVVAGSAELDTTKLNGANGAPDFSVAVLYFDNNVVARLTCSILAKHDHGMRVFGTDGTLEVHECWDNSATVRKRVRKKIRRRLIEWPLTKRLKLRQPTHPKVKRTGAASMNFALGPAEVLEAIASGRPSRMGADFALHLTEVTLAIQNSGKTKGAQIMTTDFASVPPMPWAKALK
ncbi:Predicted dehydrogenase [Cognatiyoonia koreensis]|uniref:Predicted dehydrogenase n=1 Tax=Cognatiyoonia koreensis TaxID=364200 RepID=A0A1I0RT75_9RHOB|nr:Gfo/Idh/MocA family oxidoreductase [Cognatiyoonia koreensis]SEW44482.1 Predicted dehydrogenase [Cognatiyoonia koreensis]